MTGKRPEGTYQGDGDIETIHLRSVCFTVCKYISKVRLVFLCTSLQKCPCCLVFLNAGSSEALQPTSPKSFLVIHVSTGGWVYQINFHIRIIFNLRQNVGSELSFETSGNSCFINHVRDIPSGAADKTLSSQCRGPRFDPWSGNYIPHATTKTQHSQINKC